MKLFRAMSPDANGLPQVGRSARTLGTRTPLEAPSAEPDVTATIADEKIQPDSGVMSVAPNDPATLPPFRRPPLLVGRGKDPVFEIDTADLGLDRQFRQDSPTHGLIEPARPMTLAEFEHALTATREKWVRHTG